MAHEITGALVDAKAEQHDKALAIVQQLLKARGIRSYAVHTIGLKLTGDDGRPIPLEKPKRHVPELVVHNDVGWVDATVTIGPRSGCYLVSLRNGPGLETVREPRQVADLILTAQPGGRS
ncbi:hypothetical protein [Streptosporangium sp. CA-115845]|uniref:hypothetical protein n=1 Tax=Streptosporangium sp. CA-115845 TaxID=3240071 RepID=UPI003D922999